jgi:hypothetical protein
VATSKLCRLTVIPQVRVLAPALGQDPHHVAAELELPPVEADEGAQPVRTLIRGRSCPPTTRW